MRSPFCRQSSVLKKRYRNSGFLDGIVEAVGDQFHRWRKANKSPAALSANI